MINVNPAQKYTNKKATQVSGKNIFSFFFSTRSWEETRMKILVNGRENDLFCRNSQSLGFSPFFLVFFFSSTTSFPLFWKF